MITLTSRPTLLRSTTARLFAPLSLLVFTATMAQVSHAWNAVGHMTIGAIAEARLNDNAKREIGKLLPMVNDPRSPDFMTACVWMDDIRGDGVHLYDQWHIAGLGFSPDGTPTPPVPRNAYNVTWAIEQNVQILKNEKVSDAEKARALRFVLHTVEDAHQPLHCGSRFTKENPDGDSGGNKFHIEDSDLGHNLHSVWDGALGTFKSDHQPRLQTEDRLRALALTLTTKYPETSLPQSTVLDPQQWIEEGSAYLKNDVYPTSATLDAAYIEHCLPIAERQATLAGYRLARLLNSIWPA